MKKIRLGDACDILNGFAFKSENYVDSGIRVIRIANVQKGYCPSSDEAFASSLPVFILVKSPSFTFT